VEEVGVDVSAGHRDLHVQDDPSKTYRHSMFLTANRHAVRVPANSFSELLTEHRINAVKLDIEGMEMPLLESLTEEMCRPINKLVFEWTFDVDRSAARLLAVLTKLEKLGYKVHCPGREQLQELSEYRLNPPSKVVLCTKYPSPKAHERFDIKDKLLRFDSQRLLHKNSKSEGTRYVISLFNRGMNYSGQDIDERSTKLAQLGPQAIKYLVVRQTDEVLQKRAKLIKRLEQTTFPEGRCSGRHVHSKYGSERGRFVSFGLTQSRKSQSTREEDGLVTRQDENTNNSTHLHLYGELLDYMAWFAPGVFSEEADSMFNSCIIAKNSKCMWHLDKNNVGPAALTALGDFTGGELLVEKEAATKKPPAKKSPAKEVVGGSAGGGGSSAGGSSAAVVLVWGRRR
jgi:hypothetical protein